MKLTIEELADKVNQLIAEKSKEQPELVKDGRQSSVLSTRRIRDYITKGLIDKPVGSTREKWFDESHVNALVSLRLLQHNGLSDHYIKNNLHSSYSNNDPWPFPKVDGEDVAYAVSNSKKKDDEWPFPKSKDNEISGSISNSESTDEMMQNDALDFLKSLQNGKKEQPKALASPDLLTNSVVGKDKSLSLDFQGYATNADLLRSLSQNKYRQFNEYLVDEKLGVFLKVDSKTDMVLQKQLLETIKNEITKYNNKENKNG